METFRARIDLLSTRIQDNVDKLVRKVLLAVDESVVLATPVDTGRARANWQVALDNSPTGVISAPSSPADGIAIAKAAAEKVAIAYNGNQHKAIYIANNLSYIGRLNDGWSTQAPSNFVAKAVNNGVQQIQGASILVR